MSKVNSELNQESGDNSQNLLAGRDIVIHGISRAEASEIARSVFNDNALRLSQVAEDIARSRAEKITEDFLSSLYLKLPSSAGILADPDLQMNLFAVQKSFAKSGKEELGNILTDLLIDRVSVNGDELGVVVLNEAIEVVPKLTEQQRKIVTFVFMMRHTTPSNINSLEEYYLDYVPKYLYPACEGLSVEAIDFMHLTAVRVLSGGAEIKTLMRCLIWGLEGLYTNGFEADQLSPELHAAAYGTNLFMPCLRDPTKWQINTLSYLTMGSFIKHTGFEKYTNEIESLSMVGFMTEESIHNEFLNSHPKARELSELWSNPNYCRLLLSSSGMAIGHSMYQRITGDSDSRPSWL
ncbi:MAG: hypothetical protein Q8L08_02305 [Candidatus Nanopelagicaceae bacterium]|nr:hypothetical protein [Candidatus Nanopelagicaceae bacterium]